MDKLSDVFSDLFSNELIDENNLNAIWVDIDKGKSLESNKHVTPLNRSPTKDFNLIISAYSARRLQSSPNCLTGFHCRFS
jgi:hypothetical protein